MVIFIMDILNKEKFMELEFFIGMMVKFMMDNGNLD